MKKDVKFLFFFIKKTNQKAKMKKNKKNSKKHFTK